MKIKNLFIASAAAVLCLTSCNETTSIENSLSDNSSLENSTSETSSQTNVEQEKLSFKAICPKGAPGLALTSYLSTDPEQVELGTPLMTKNAFFSEDYDAIIFDATTANTLIDVKKAKFKLASIITAGNAFVLATGNDDNTTMEEGDSIVSFGNASSVWNRVLQNDFSITNISYLGSAALAASTAITGINEGESVDYVVVAEPYVTKVLTTNTDVSVKYNLKEEWAKYSKAQGLNDGNGFTDFPQAGLFISDRLDAATDQTTINNIENFISIINKNADDLIDNDGKNVMAQITKDTDKGLYTTDETFGIDKDILATVVDSNKSVIGVKNALAFNSSSYDYDGFMTKSGSLGYTKPLDTFYSHYFNANHD
ncbi:MAG: hypothetical protein PHW22_03615 [Bacilli bacterium]|nr:hypothetical protein [Bacilli bacterium]